MMNKSLQAAINTVFEANSPTLTVVSMEILSSSNSSYTHIPLMINELRITQTFSGISPTQSNYSDVIMAQFDISSSDYVKMYDNRQDLMCILTFNFCDNDGKIIRKVKPTKMTYRAVPLNMRDLRKEMTDTHLRVDFDNTMTLQLIDPVAYLLRLKPINVIYRAMNMTSIIRHICCSVGASVLELTAPDSDAMTFDQVIIPPFTDFSKVFGQLQTKYGVYMNGISQYITNGIIYIYAPYDTAPKTKNTLTLYQATQGLGAGRNSFHKQMANGDYQVVIGTMSTANDLSLLGAENHGTSSMFLRSALLVDGIVQSDSSGNVSYAPSSSVAVRVNDPTTASAQNVNNKYRGTTNNMFAAASELVAHRAIIVNSEWANAIPLSILPGEAVVYYSDHAGKIRKRTGIVEAVDYGLRKVFRSSSGIVMACMGHLTTRLNPVAVDSDSVG